MDLRLGEDGFFILLFPCFGSEEGADGGKGSGVGGEDWFRTVVGYSDDK